MSDIPRDVRAAVIDRASNHCEYCRLSQVGQEAEFHIDHITPISAGGATTLDNLALACVSCSLRKGARLTAIDPQTDRESPLFNPRDQTWTDHFRWDGVRLVGLTSIGRATVAALSMNRSLILAIREEERVRGRHPLL